MPDEGGPTTDARMSEEEISNIEYAPWGEAQEIWVGGYHVIDIIPREDRTGYAIWCRCDNESMFVEGLDDNWPAEMVAHCGLTSEEGRQVRIIGILGGPSAAVLLIRDYFARRAEWDDDDDG